MWDVTSGAELAVLAGHVGPVWHTDFNYDGSLVVKDGVEIAVLRFVG